MASEALGSRPGRPQMGRLTQLHPPETSLEAEKEIVDLLLFVFCLEASWLAKRGSRLLVQMSQVGVPSTLAHHKTSLRAAQEPPSTLPMYFRSYAVGEVCNPSERQRTPIPSRTRPARSRSCGDLTAVPTCSVEGAPTPCSARPTFQRRDCRWPAALRLRASW